SIATAISSTDRAGRVRWNSAPANDSIPCQTVRACAGLFTMRKLLSVACSVLLGACGSAEAPPPVAGPVAAPVAAPVATPIAEPVIPAVPSLEQELAYGEGAKDHLVGFLAVAADAAEPLPGIIVIHEWWGLNDDIKTLPRRLAREG